MVDTERGAVGGSVEVTRSESVWPVGHASLAAFAKADNVRAAWQVVNTLIPYACLWWLMVRSVQLGWPYALTMVLALPTAAFLLRLFILFHDCVHNSLFPSKGANTFFGYLFGVLVFTSFEAWRFSHIRHHGAYANLDARGDGDIWTLTRKEYESLSPRAQFAYRLYRNPAVLVGLGALFNFLLSNRLPTRKLRRKERSSLLFTNVLILGVVLVAVHFIGWRVYILSQLPVMWLAGAAGIWLFYVQHQFAGVYWARKRDWNPVRAAMEGSSFYRLPTLLRWFSGNIGFHHVHHLSSRIPNYRLKQCYDGVPELRTKVPLDFAGSFSVMRLKVWDEERGELVGFPSGRAVLSGGVGGD